MIKTQEFFLLCLLLILWSPPIFSQEETLQDTQLPHKETGRRQSKNSDLIKSFGNIKIQLKDYDTKTGQRTFESFERCYPDAQAWVKSRQAEYDAVLVREILWKYPNTVRIKDRPEFTINKDDLKKLEWVIKTNKSSYQPGEPIGISVSLRNISTERVWVRLHYTAAAFIRDSMMIAKIWKDEKQGVSVTAEAGRRSGYMIDISRPFSSGYLEPGDIRRIHLPYKALNWYYDLSETGEYELTFYTRNFLGTDEEQIGEYPKPCTVRFKIEGDKDWLDQHVVWEDGRKVPPYEEEEEDKE